MKLRKIFSLLFVMCFCGTLFVNAQSSAVKKVADATFTLTTFDKEGSIMSTTNGVFVSSDGVCVSTWKPFIGAEKAVIIDNKGQRYDVEMLLGANEIYDIVKFKVNAKTIAAKLSSSVSDNSEAWIVQPSKVGMPEKAVVSKVETFMNKYNYAVLNTSAPEKMNGAPVVNPQGQVIGIYNNSGELRSSTDAGYAVDFKLVGLSQNDLTMQQCGICVGLPDNSDEAVIALMLSSRAKETIKQQLLNEFIKKFPTLNNGYSMLATDLIVKGDIANADKILTEAISKATAKDEAHYNYSRLIYKGITLPSLKDKVSAQGWTLDKAMNEVEKAIKEKELNVYKHLKAQILYAKGDYKQAKDGFESLTKTDIKNPELYLELAQCAEQMKGNDDEILGYLNKSIELCDTPYVQNAAPYFFARAQQYDKMGQYRAAMKDLYVYEFLNRGRLDASFYYMREQIEVKGKLWQQAMQDILIATQLAPEEPMYFAETGNLFLRLGKYDDAILAAQTAVKLNSEYSEAYLILGIAQCKSNKKDEGKANIEKAKVLGNPQADNFLKRLQ